MNRDQHFLDYAIRLGTRGLGRTWPNPSVGCVLVKDGQILAATRTADGGRPHAETIALAQAGDAARGATAYVSLEPCAHHGKTPPCALSLIDAGITRVVYAQEDPDPRVRGKGIEMLRQAGIDIAQRTTHDAPPIHRGFFSRVEKNRPYVAMKLATSLDGYITDGAGNSQWITGAKARANGHGLRNSVDAVLTGIGTVLADDPQLTVRLPGLAHPRLVRIVADRQLQLPLTSKLVKSAETQPVWVITSTHAIEQAASHATDLRERGVNILALEDPALPPDAILKSLADAGITRLLVEAGATLSTAFLAAHCVDTLHWYRAPILLGNTGKSAISSLDTLLKQAAHHHMVASITLGDDRCDIIELKHAQHEQLRESAE